jgi:hypothetical protein
MPTQGVAETVETPNPAHFIQVPPLTSSPTHITDLSAISVGPRFGLGDLDVIATGQVAQEDHSAVKAKASSLKFMQRMKLTIPASAPSTPPLIMPPGNRTGSTPDAFLSSLLDPFEGPSVLKCGRSWNLGPLPTSSTKGGERGLLEIQRLD